MVSLDFNEIKAQSQGRWPGIYQALGISVGDGRHCGCPVCGGKDRFRMDDKDGRGTFFCNNCGSGDGVSLVQKVLNCEIKEAFEAVAKVMGTAIRNPLTEEKPVDPEMFRKLIRSSRYVKKNDPVHKYLKNRGLLDLPSTLYYAPKCWEKETRKEWPAMLAIFRLSDGEAVTIQRTYIKNGEKVKELIKPKKIMPTLKKMTGGAVRLYEGKPEALAVCEGIETGIAIHQMYGHIVWPCLSAPLLEAFDPPDWISTLHIYTDNDSNYAGEKAAYCLANRVATKNKLAVQVHHPKLNDFLDDLNMGISK